MTKAFQVSGDEQRRLCEQGTGSGGSGSGAQSLGLGLAALTTYGSVAYQLKDANMEASGTCDFLCRAISIVNRTGESFFFRFNLRKCVEWHVSRTWGYERAGSDWGKLRY